MKLDKNSPVPAYYQILVDLEKRIAQKEWNLGELLPSEGELVKYYHVSRVTVRQALEKLVNKKIITRKRGQGTFLAFIPEPIEHDFSFPSEFKEKVLHFGIQLVAKVIAIEEIQDSRLAERLAIGREEPIIHISRLFSSNNLPYSLNHSWIPQKLVPEIREKGLINNSLSQTLEMRYRISPAMTDNWIETIDADQEIAALLGLEPGSVLLYLTTVQKMKEDRIFEYSHTYWVRDKIRFHLSKYHD